jgi:acyl-CoA synthetase (AMP-forming)/AMP-acid ligase II
MSYALGPRGEIIVGGPMVANGYYNLTGKTAESFYEENGTKWFRTGESDKDQTFFSYSLDNYGRLYFIHNTMSAL